MKTKQSHNDVNKCMSFVLGHIQSDSRLKEACCTLETFHSPGDSMSERVLQQGWTKGKAEMGYHHFPTCWAEHVMRKFNWPDCELMRQPGQHFPKHQPCLGFPQKLSSRPCYKSKRLIWGYAKKYTKEKMEIKSEQKVEGTGYVCESLTSGVFTL